MPGGTAASRTFLTLLSSASYTSGDPARGDWAEEVRVRVRGETMRTNLADRIQSRVGSGGRRPWSRRHRLVAVALACLAGTLALQPGSAAASRVTCFADVRGGTYPDDPEAFRTFFRQDVGPIPESATAGTLDSFSRNYGPCPDAGAANYLCWGAYARAEGTTLRARARVTRKNVIGPVQVVVFADATTSFEEMNVVSPVPVASAVVTVGRDGSTIGNASGDVSVNDEGVPCLVGSVCEPVRMPNFDRSMRISLRAYAAVGEGNQVPVDAHSDGDYLNTVKVLAIELHDANDQKIPDAVVTLTDDNGNVTFTFPNTVQSTTVPGATTTTTVPSGGCEVTATAASIECRLAALAVLVRGSAGKLAPKLGKQLAKATGGMQKAAQPGASERRVAKGLRTTASTRSGATTRCSDRRRPGRRSTTEHVRRFGLPAQPSRPTWRACCRRSARREADRQRVGSRDPERRLPHHVARDRRTPEARRERQQRLLQLGARQRRAEAVVGTVPERRVRCPRVGDRIEGLARRKRGLVVVRAPQRQDDDVSGAEADVAMHDVLRRDARDRPHRTAQAEHLLDHRRRVLRPLPTASQTAG